MRRDARARPHRTWAAAALALALLALLAWRAAPAPAAARAPPNAPNCTAELTHERALRRDAERLVGVFQARAEAAAAAAGERDRCAAQVRSLEARVRELERANADLRATTTAERDTSVDDRADDHASDASDADDDASADADASVRALRDDAQWLRSLPPALRNVERAQWRVPGVLRALNPLSAAQERRWAGGERKAFVTVATRAQYLVGLYALGVSLTRVEAAHPLAALLSRELAARRDVLANLTAAGYHFVRPIDEIFNPAITIGKLSQVHKTGIFTKLRVFELTEFSQVVYLDGDTVVNRNIDALLELPDEFAVAPEIMGMKNCQHDGFERFIFTEDGNEYCRSHSKEPYHGRTYQYSNSGVMMLRPANETFNALMALLRKEVEYDDTCIGSPGCNDQRLINMYYADRPYKRLHMLYNVYCDKFLTEQYRDVPFVFHYRGANAGKWGSVSQGMKPWIMAPDSDPREWQDLCHVFLTNHIEFERRWALQQPLKRQAALMSAAQLRREWRRLREQQLASYLQQRIDGDSAHGQAAALLGMLSSNDTDVRQKAATALVGLGYRSALWLAELGLFQYIELFKRLDLTPDNLFYRLRKPTDLKEIGIGTEYRDAIMNKIRDEHQQLLLDDRFHQRLYTAEKRLEDLVGIVETVRTHYKAELEQANKGGGGGGGNDGGGKKKNKGKDRNLLSVQVQMPSIALADKADAATAEQVEASADSAIDIDPIAAATPTRAADVDEPPIVYEKKSNVILESDENTEIDFSDGSQQSDADVDAKQESDDNDDKVAAAQAAHESPMQWLKEQLITTAEIDELEQRIATLKGIKRVRAADALRQARELKAELDERMVNAGEAKGLELQRLAQAHRSIVARMDAVRSKLQGMLAQSAALGGQ